MKFLCLKGGLGNQLFEYCRYQQLRAAGMRVFMHYDRQQLNMHGGTLLSECFDVMMPPVSLPVMALTLLLKGIRRTGLFPRLFDDEDPACILIDDYCQNRRYITDAASMLPFRSDVRRWVGREWLEKIEQSPCSVAVHVRRGDYLHPANITNFGTCPEAYYRKAIDALRQQAPEAELFFFSDDIAWTREHLAFDGAHYVEHDNGQPDWADLYLMTRCRHHIIANSTFSFWGAYLAPQDGARNFYPAQWYANTQWTAPDIFPDEWVKVNC